jgi:hypothetical protein
VLVNEDGLGIEAGVELDLVKRGEIGGVGDGNEQAFAAAVQGQSVVFCNQVGLHQSLGQKLRIEGVMSKRGAPNSWEAISTSR